MQIRQWLDKLPEPYRSKALKNTKKLILPLTRRTIQEALDSAFLWERTPQGHGYWEYVHEQLLLQN